jgi:putative membrane protein
MRETIAGFYGANYVIDLLVLCLFIAPALFIGIFMHKHFRNVDALFDQELCDTDLFNFDKTGDAPTHFDIATLMAAAMDSETYHDYFEQRAEGFQRKYPALRNAGFIAIGVITPIGLLVSWLTDVKLIILLCWVIAVVLICSYLIILEYMHQRVRSQVDLTMMSKDQVNELLSDQLKRRYRKAKKRLRSLGKDGE